MILRKSSGFTLVEMVVVLALTGVVAVMGINFLSQPIEGFMDISRRARLVARAEVALARMTMETRLALPNSLRTVGNSVEFLRTLSGGRYRSEIDPGLGGPGDILDFSISDNSFHVMGELLNSSDVQSCASCLLVVYNTGQAGANAYAGDNVSNITAVIPGSPTLISFNNMQFPFASPRQRFQVIDTPVSYVCNLGSGELRRVSAYAITASQSVSPAGSSHLLVDHVSACSFTYSAGTASRAGLLSLSLTLTDEGENVNLLQQIHIPNAP